jgi:hypothetical protein
MLLALLLEVFVPLCDSALIACGRGALGDPHSLEGNLYWGARYGAERFLTRSLRIVSRRDLPGPALLREVLLEGPSVQILLKAYAGDRIDDALHDFLRAAAGATDADVVVWAGHDRLMDVTVEPPRAAKPKPVAVLACSSERYFGPVLKAIGAPPIVLTRSFMAPEAYLLEALAGSLAKNGIEAKALHREALAAAYARYQRISRRSAESVFSRLSK